MGIAGGGAQEQARRAAARVDRLRHELSAAELREQLAAAERREHAWSAGAEGERLVAQALSELEPHGWRTLHDVHWPGRPKANLDHVVVGPGGVVVVDAKNWSGAVGVRDGHLRQNGSRRDQALEGAASATAAVAALLPPRHRSAARGVVCLAGQSLPPTGTTGGVVVVGRDHLVAHLRSLPPRLSPREVTKITEFLRTQLDSPGLATIGAPVPRRRTSVRRQLLELLLALVFLFVASGLLVAGLSRLGGTG
ncbi:nuclease-related domain-containing protein [Kineococcus rhizosphaerae]|uniref:Nuclease-like protein n=1 Tax=Kineococcus rhizosphaerae TaxID=559628 RepID=A0A2T0QX07_9ACTN|nr:nuclease-related domain-containing protein [Kineococcus rhizosphaerae]PRY10246.1 nuclease-like protein [Kineococcus rhizosphaerae]